VAKVFVINFKELTAAGTVAELHDIPFSSFGRQPSGNQCATNVKQFILGLQIKLLTLVDKKIEYENNIKSLSLPFRHLSQERTQLKLQ